MNLVVQYGRLVSNPELKKSKNGKEYARFAIAVSKGYQGKSYLKDKKSQTDFFNWVAFGSAATNLCDYGKRGDRLNVLGHMQSDKYMTEAGARYSTSLVADIIEIGFSGSGNGSQHSATDTLATMMNISQISNESDYGEEEFEKSDFDEDNLF